MNEKASLFLQRRNFAILLFTFFPVLSILFFKCSNDTITGGGSNTPLDTSSFTYPFSIGSSWNFEKTITADNIRPDSIRHYFSNYPVHGTGTIRIQNDTVINGVTTRCFYENSSDSSTISQSWKYFLQTGNALIGYAYRIQNGVSYMPDNFLVQNSGNVTRPVYNIHRNFNLSSNVSDTLIIRYPADTCLIYPIVKAAEWLYLYNGSMSIYKNYLNFENISVNGNYITAIKTQRIYSDTNIIFYDYYSKFGDLKEELTFKNIEVTNEFGQILGYADIGENYNVTSYNIVNP